MGLFTLKSDIENLIAQKQKLEKEADDLKKQVISEKTEVDNLKSQKDD